MTERSTMHKPADRERWLELRQPYFNASAAAVLYDRHPYLSPGDYAAEKLSGHQQPETDAMRRGKFMEEGIASWWAHDHGVDVIEPTELYVAGRMMATVDRALVIDPDRIIEIKTANHRVVDPEAYWLDQCQAIMHCVGTDHIELVWVDSTMRMQSETIDARPAFQTEMAERAEAFMAAIDMDIVPDWVQPTLTASNITSLYPDPAGEVELDEDARVYVEAYRVLRDQRARIDDDMKQLRDEIARILGDHTTGLFDGQPIVTFAASKPPRRFDLTRFRDDHPDLADEYELVGEPTRRLVLK